MTRSPGVWHALRYSEGRVAVTPPQPVAVASLCPHPSPAPLAACTFSTPFGVPQGMPHAGLLGMGAAAEESCFCGDPEPRRGERGEPLASESPRGLILTPVRIR